MRGGINLELFVVTIASGFAVWTAHMFVCVFILEVCMC